MELGWSGNARHDVLLPDDPIISPQPPAGPNMDESYTDCIYASACWTRKGRVGAGGGAIASLGRGLWRSLDFTTVAHSTHARTTSCRCPQDHAIHSRPRSVRIANI